MYFLEDDHGFWDNVHQSCVDASDEVGQATNWMYDTVAARGLPDDTADHVGNVVGGFVDKHWPNMRDLPANIDDAVSDFFRGRRRDYPP